LGCRYGAKWTAISSLEAAQRQGAQVLYDTRVREVIVENGRAVGVLASGAEGNVTLRGSRVILAAGGLESPVILQHSGIPAGEGLFVDLMTNTYGLVDEVDALHEPTMALVNHEFHDSKGFIVSPFVNHSRLARVIELGVQGAMLPSQRLVGMMTKIVDEAVGRVYPDGTFSKPVTARDQSRLDAGAALIKELLREIGAEPASFITSRVQGAHPGGTAAIGRVVDRDLQTRVEGLFVCDGSVLPEAPGLPPILTLVALAKRLAQTLA
jgi:choline dehydrogenase-like flavoprotein